MNIFVKSFFGFQCLVFLSSIAFSAGDQAEHDMGNRVGVNPLRAVVRPEDHEARELERARANAEWEEYMNQRPEVRELRHARFLAALRRDQPLVMLPVPVEVRNAMRLPVADERREPVGALPVVDRRDKRRPSDGDESAPKKRRVDP